MSGPKIRVKFKLSWQTYRVGDIIEPAATLRDWLLGNGYVEVIAANEAEVPNRPARLAERAAKKLAEQTPKLFA